jgi:carbamoyl-phosphate synthase large subunit
MNNRTIDTIRAASFRSQRRPALVPAIRVEGRHVDGRGHELTNIDYWFLDHLIGIHGDRRSICADRRTQLSRQTKETVEAKQAGFSDRQMAQLWDSSEMEVRRNDGNRWALLPPSNRSIPAPPNLKPTRRTITRLMKQEDETPPKRQTAIMILGGGPNRIGQGIEFDYCCCHASYALARTWALSRSWSIPIRKRSVPITTPATCCSSNRLTVEDVLNICDRIQPDGVIVQFGGQTPLNLARALSMPEFRSSGQASTRSKPPKTARNFSSCSHDWTSSNLPTVSPGR